MKNLTLPILFSSTFLLCNFYNLQGSEKIDSDALIINGTNTTQYVHTSFTIPIDEKFLATDSEILTIPPNKKIKLPAGTDCIILHRAFKAREGSVFVIKKVDERKNKKDNVTHTKKPRYTLFTGKRK